MPNHITNRIQFYGKQENINKVLELIKGEDTCIDFNKIIPMPKELNLPASTDADVSIKYVLSKMSYGDKSKIKNILRNTRCSFYGNYYDKIFGHNPPDGFIEERAKDFEKRLESKDISFGDMDYESLGIHSFEDLGNAYLRNIIKYGCDTWYDWCCDKWGTKWNAYNTEWDEEQNVMEFDTAWSCPIPLLEEFGYMCDEYEVWFEGMWADEDCGNNTGTFNSNYFGEGVWNVEYVENGSNEAYEIYIEVKGESDCIGPDSNGNLIHYDCDNCPNPCC